MIQLIVLGMLLYIVIDDLLDLFKEKNDMSGIIKSVAPDWDDLDDLNIKQICKDITKEVKNAGTTNHKQN